MSTPELDTNPDATGGDTGRGAGSPVRETFPLGLHWPTLDPFLFVAHHDDDYPAGDEQMAPAEPLGPRQIGSDFSGRDGWSMYHGDSVPGFPAHPHRGFETITYVRRGLIDHSDSLGATARFGRGDTQWLTTGAGVVHSEMFPLVNRDSRNPTELFQIWLNLPASSKFAQPYFTMFWGERIPTLVHDRDGSLVEVRNAAGDAAGDLAVQPGTTTVTVIAGSVPGAGARGEPLAPPPDSWASNPDADVAVWHVVMGAGARWVLPEAASSATERMLYAFEGSGVELSSASGGATASELRSGTGARLAHPGAVELHSEEGVELLLLQGRPIAEPVARYGPFVMNTRSEIMQAMDDYQQTQFGGWPWGVAGPAHPADRGRFAIHPDGREEDPREEDPREEDPREEPPD